MQRGSRRIPAIVLLSSSVSLCCSRTFGVRYSLKTQPRRKKRNAKKTKANVSGALSPCLAKTWWMVVANHGVFPPWKTVEVSPTGFSTVG